MEIGHEFKREASDQHIHTHTNTLSMNASNSALFPQANTIDFDLD